MAQDNVSFERVVFVLFPWNLRKFVVIVMKYSVLDVVAVFVLSFSFVSR
jgi:hypothetical protein